MAKDVIKLKILRWGEYSGLSRQALNTFMGFHIRGRQKEILLGGEGHAIEAEKEI